MTPVNSEHILWKCSKIALCESKVLGLSLTCCKCYLDTMDTGTIPIESVPHPFVITGKIEVGVLIKILVIMLFIFAAGKALCMINANTASNAFAGTMPIASIS